ncbi:MAG TPA: tetratricopeptide repeat protein [Opitutaceae bacterium]|jgi:predicted O-linked N-acetylglucosamine transferase (SPINDLY family)|nr:tetratricopeptide repeat protein [Opitutaceae bacterium]
MLSADQSSQLATAVEHHLAGRYPEADRIYSRLHAAAAEDYQVNHLFGVLRHQQGRSADALPLLKKARRLMPRSAPTAMCYGLALGALGRRDEAEAALRIAVNLDPRGGEAWGNLGAHYAVDGRTPEAIACFQRAIDVTPDYAAGWTGLGAVLHLAGRSLEAIGCHTKALELEPENSKARFGRAQALQACHRAEEAQADFDAHLQLRPNHHEARSFRLFLLNYRDDLSREALAEEHRAYGRAVEAELAPGAEPVFTQDAAPDRRLRIAFLSPDLRNHSVAYFLEPLLAHLDRSQFEVMLYHDHFCCDAMTEKLRERTAVWRRFAGQSHETVEKAIREDAPDVLVDLAGHTGFNRLEIFARRLAPVQLSYLGYPNTTGLKAMDFRLTDAVADPAGAADALHTERLLRFAPTAWSYLPPMDAPLAPPAGPRPVTFGSFNALSKVNGSTLRLWREVLAAVPGSRLVLKSSGLDAARWRRLLDAAGIAADRSELWPMSATVPEHLARYAEIDVALDPFPYNGTTTTCEALWMGVPVVTLAGDRHAARVGASLLTAACHPEWIAASRPDYVRIAAGLAAAPELRARLRAGLREEMKQSALLDHPGQAARFAAAVRQAWAAWCETQAVCALPA